MKHVIVAEIGTNHGGNLQAALELVESLEVDVIKLQKMQPSDFLTAEEYDKPHPIPENAHGPTYGAHREALELDIDDYHKVSEAARKKNMGFASSVCDITSAELMFEKGPVLDYVKIPSCQNGNDELIELVKKHQRSLNRNNFLIHISTGMMTNWQIHKLKQKYPHDYIYSCLSNYCDKIDAFYSAKGFGGFSCHTPSIYPGLYAAGQGATYIEYHVTLDRNSRGGDHAISLLPEEINNLKQIIDGLNVVERSHDLNPLEKAAHDKLRRGKP